MGLFSVFKLASDYNKAQKYLKEKDISVDKARKVITSMAGILKQTAVVQQ